MKSASSFRLALAAIILGGLALRLTYLFLQNSPLYPDELRFYNSSLHFAEHLSIPANSTDMPLLIVLFGLLERWLAVGMVGMKVVNILISGLVILFISEIAYLLSRKESARLIAAGAAAVYPFFLYYSELILAETVFLALLSGAFCFLLRRQLVVAALFFVLAQLTKPTIIYFFPLVLAWYAWTARGQEPLARVAVRVVLAAVVFLLLLTPWVIRNYQVHGIFMAGKPSGHVFWEGNNPWNPEGGVAQDNWQYMENRPPGLSFMEQDRWERDQAVAYIKEDPVRFLKTAGHKFMRFWHLWPNAPAYATGIYKWASLLSFGPVLLLALVSLWILRDRWRQTGILWLFFTYYTAIHMVTIGSIRYRLPLEPLLIALAAACLARFLFRSTLASPTSHA